MLVELHVAGLKHLIGHRIVEPILRRVRGEADEDASARSGAEFRAVRFRDMRVRDTAEWTQVIGYRFAAVPCLEWRDVADCLGGKTVAYVYGVSGRLRPERLRKTGSCSVVRTASTMVRLARSTTPFCDGVYAAVS